MDTLPTRLALHRSNISPPTLYALLTHFGSAEATLSASHAALQEIGLQDKTIQRLKSADTAAIERDLRWADQDNHSILCVHDELYPVQLKSLHQPPYLLFVAGDVDYLHQPQLAMVGSRTPTATGRRTATEFAQYLSQSGFTITSGLARGIDTACHQGALQGLAGSVAVVANGLDKVYPACNTKLAQHIVTQGCVVSESPLGTAPHKGLFPKRNRIISGLSLGTLVVEAAKGSGSLITAKHALQQGREVFAIPGSIHNPLSRGCHSLIRQGAKLVETAQDIIEELLPLVNVSASSHTSAKFNPTQTDTCVDPAYQHLLDSMEYEPASIDELIQRNQLNAAEIASMLLILELQGQVVSQNGQYSRISTNA
jgi:DNA processing protein